MIIETVNRNGGHLGSNLGIVELTIALHRVFESPHDVILFDTGHQTYPHKLLTGRRDTFDSLRSPGGMSGYPSRIESSHDWIENSHASTALAYAHGLSTAFKARGEDRRVVAVVGDGSLTGGMAHEGLNNLGHSSSDVTIILNDNGRSYAPTISKLSESLIKLPRQPRVHAPTKAHRAYSRVDSVGRGHAPPRNRRHQDGHPPDVGPARHLRATRYPLRRTVQRPPDRGTREGTREGQALRRTNRGACDHAEGPRIQTCRERPDQEHARSLFDQAGQLHGGVRRASGPPGRTPPRSWLRSPPRCPTPQACCPS